MASSVAIDPVSPLKDGGPGLSPTAGSVNQTESPAGTSPTALSPLSREDGVEFLEGGSVTGTVSGRGGFRVGSSVAGSGGDTLTGRMGGDFLSSSISTISNLTKVSEVKMPSGLSDKDLNSDRVKVSLQDGQNERGGSSKLKDKTSKAERRALQEAQRAAKAAAKDGGVSINSKQAKVTKPPSQKRDGASVTGSIAASEKLEADRNLDKDRKKDVPHPRMQFDDKTRVEKAKKRAVVKKCEAKNTVELFRHLPQYEHGTLQLDLESKFFHLDPMHPAVYKVGLKYLAGDTTGGNARCIAMLLALREVIGDYFTPPEKTLTRDLTAKISSCVSFLIECRPLSISMGNAIRFLKSQIAKLPVTFSETEAKCRLTEAIDHFINDKIVLADKIIVELAVTKIRDGDVLLTYGFSSVIEMIMLSAYESKKQFRVVVVDSRPKLEGQLLLRRLVAKGISCSYTHINAISYVMHEVTRVFLGASSVLSNGTVYSRVGTACVAMVAHAFRVPVLICCEAYKFHNRVQLDSICSNELGDPSAISKVAGRDELIDLVDWTSHENLQLLNLKYDATPSDYVSLIVTDYGMVPPTSVPVIVREYCREQPWT